MNFDESSNQNKTDQVDDYNEFSKIKGQTNVEITNESFKDTSDNYLTKFTSTNPRILNLNQSTFLQD